MAAPMTTLAFNASHDLTPNVIVSFRRRQVDYGSNQRGAAASCFSAFSARRQLILAHSVRHLTVRQPRPRYDEAV
jgi:hypothetical protein